MMMYCSLVVTTLIVHCASRLTLEPEPRGGVLSRSDL